MENTRGKFRGERCYSCYSKCPRELKNRERTE